jgi:hypothetical protein
MESVMSASGLDTQRGHCTPSDISDTPPVDLSQLTDRLSTLLIDEGGASRFLGDYAQHFYSKGDI